MELGIFMGRFQPVHNGHTALITDALLSCKKLIILVGSDSCIRTNKNPFLSNERIDMIKMSLQDDILDRLIFGTMKDYDSAIEWAKYVKDFVSEMFPGVEPVGLFGYVKDDSSYYLKMFPEYKSCLLSTSYFNCLSSTSIRKKYFEDKQIDTTNLSIPVSQYLEKFMMDHQEMFKEN